MKIRRRALLSGALSGTATALALPAAARAQHLVEGAYQIVPSMSDYEKSEIEGRPLYVAKSFHARNERLLRDCLEFLTDSLKGLAKIVPAAAWRKLADVPVWLEYDDPLCPHSCYLDSRRFLTAHRGLPDKAGGVEFTKDIWAWRQYQPMLVLHELAHAYHDRVLTFDDPSIRAAYARAVKSGKYDRVRRNSGEVGPAYAMRNFREFFAELSESYFGRNDYEPYTAADLKRLDPESYAVIEAAWNRP